MMERGSTVAVDIRSAGVLPELEVGVEDFWRLPFLRRAADGVSRVVPEQPRVAKVANLEEGRQVRSSALAVQVLADEGHDSLRPAAVLFPIWSPLS